MKLKVNEYTPIRSLLNIAITREVNYQDDHLSVMVSDALSLIESSENRLHVNRRMYKYSAYISKHAPGVVQGMNPAALTHEDYERLLEIFNRL